MSHKGISDSRGEEFDGKVARARCLRSCGMGDVIATIFGKYSLPQHQEMSTRTRVSLESGGEIWSVHVICKSLQDVI